MRYRTGFYHIVLHFITSAAVLLSVTGCGDLLSSPNASEVRARLASEGSPIAGTETQITDAPEHQRHPHIFGDRLVWNEARTDGYHLFLRNLETGSTTQIEDGGAGYFSLGVNLFEPDIHEDAIVWDRYIPPPLEGTNVILYDANTGEEELIREGGPEKKPAVTEDWIVWGNGNIHLFDRSSGTVRKLTDHPLDQNRPAISDGRIVWQDLRNGHSDIYLYDIGSETETRITTNPDHQRRPDIFGDRIVWRDERHASAEIYLHDLSKNTTTRITNDGVPQFGATISEKWVAWSEERSGNDDVYLYNISTGRIAQLTDEPASQGNPDIWDNRIVWEDYRNGNGDIYMFTIEEGPPHDQGAAR